MAEDEGTEEASKPQIDPAATNAMIHVAGFDTTRIFCNSFTILKNPSFVVIVAKEQFKRSGDVGPIERNLSSWLLPMDAALKLRDLLVKNFPPEPKVDR